MKRSIKTLEDMGGLPDLRTYTGSIRKSGKPDLPTSAILGLYMRRNERDRILTELKRLKKRRVQLHNKLKDIEKEMTKLLEKTTKTAVEMRGEAPKGSLSSSPAKKGRMVLRY